MRSNNCTQSNHQAPLASLTECYKLVTLISKDSSSFSESSTAYGHLYYNPYTKDTTKTKQTPHPTEIYISMTPSLNSLKAFSFLDWQPTRNSSTRLHITNQLLSGFEPAKLEPSVSYFAIISQPERACHRTTQQEKIAQT